MAAHARRPRFPRRLWDAGRRIEKGVNGALTKYVYDDEAILLEYGGEQDKFCTEIGCSVDRILLNVPCKRTNGCGGVG